LANPRHRAPRLTPWCVRSVMPGPVAMKSRCLRSSTMAAVVSTIGPDAGVGHSRRPSHAGSARHSRRQGVRQPRRPWTLRFAGTSASATAITMFLAKRATTASGLPSHNGSMSPLMYIRRDYQRSVSGRTSQAVGSCARCRTHAARKSCRLTAETRGAFLRRPASVRIHAQVPPIFPETSARRSGRRALVADGGRRLLQERRHAPPENDALWADLGDSLAKELEDYSAVNALDSISAYEHEFGRPRLIERLSELLLVHEARPGDAHRAFCSIPFKPRTPLSRRIVPGRPVLSRVRRVWRSEKSLRRQVMADQLPLGDGHQPMESLTWGMRSSRGNAL
jgi:hypothetical protein